MDARVDLAGLNDQWAILTQGCHIGSDGRPGSPFSQADPAVLIDHQRPKSIPGRQGHDPIGHGAGLPVPGLEAAIECRQEHIGNPVGWRDRAGARLGILSGRFGGAKDKMQACAGQVDRHDRDQGIGSFRIRLDESPVGHGMAGRILDIS